MKKLGAWDSGCMILTYFMFEVMYFCAIFA